MKKILLLGFTLCMATLLVACGSDSDADSNKKDNDKDKSGEVANQADKDVTVSDDEKVKKDDVVAKVNDKKLKGNQYNNIYALTKSSLGSHGEDVKDTDSVKKQALESLVQQELIKQDADKKDIHVKDKDIDKQMDQIKSSGKDQFKKKLDQFGLSEKGYKDQLKLSMMTEMYMDKELSKPDVSKDDVKAYYDKLKEQSEGQKVPKFDKVKDQIKQQLVQQKKSEQLQKQVNKLKEKAKIKHMI